MTGEGLQSCFLGLLGAVRQGSAKSLETFGLCPAEGLGRGDFSELVVTGLNTRVLPFTCSYVDLCP